MNSRSSFRCLLVGMLCLLMTGCSTYLLVNRSNREADDTFVPKAVFQSTNGGDLALEGKLARYNEKPEGKKAHMHADSYLLLPSIAFGSGPFPTNGRAALMRIERPPPDHTAQHPKIQPSLPSGYLKICALPPEGYWLVVKKHYPDRGVLFFLPFTVALDAATFPFSWLGGYMLWSHPC